MKMPSRAERPKCSKARRTNRMSKWTFFMAWKWRSLWPNDKLKNTPSSIDDTKQKSKDDIYCVHERRSRSACISHFRLSTVLLAFRSTDKQSLIRITDERIFASFRCYFFFFYNILRTSTSLPLTQFTRFFGIITAGTAASAATAVCRRRQK